MVQQANLATTKVASKKMEQAFIAQAQVGKPLLEVSNLTKRFGKFVANDSISLTINKGECVGILGANGAGKTTLVEQIVGILRPTSGEIKYLFDYRKSPQEKMGMQFQSSSYPDGISVKDVIDFSLDIYNKKIPKDELMRLLAVFQMDKFYKAPAKALSGGQQQKLNVLLAILHSPELIILDEISTGLDVLAREQILEFVDQTIKQKSLTALLISHHMSEIEALCKRVIVLSQGRKILDASVDELKRQYGSLEEMMRGFVQREIAAGRTGEPALEKKLFVWRAKGNGRKSK